FVPSPQPDRGDDPLTSSTALKTDLRLARSGQPSRGPRSKPRPTSLDGAALAGRGVNPFAIRRAAAGRVRERVRAASDEGVTDQHGKFLAPPGLTRAFKRSPAPD